MGVFFGGGQSFIGAPSAGEEEGMATHSSILVWRIPWAEEPGGLQSMGSQELDMTEATACMHT